MPISFERQLPCAIIFFVARPSAELVDRYLDFGVRRFAFVGSFAQEWSDCYYDAFDARLISDKPLIENAECLIFTDKTVDDCLNVLSGMSEVEGDVFFLVR